MEDGLTKISKSKGAGRKGPRMDDTRALGRALDTTAKALAAKAAGVKG
jgi:hypothetical protein